ncbi:addiction module toxin RelE [Oscillatoriales cyanobacterium USR001]|nr:addiction module toxin RelE [Oscillatoriales cyanobacterium USR001]
MTPEQPFKIIPAREVAEHLAAIDRKYHSLIRSTIKEQLSYNPEVETRNRKPLRQPSDAGATWELRLGSDNEFRVFYQTISDTHEVHILVVAVKIGNQLFVSGQEFEL